MARAYKNTIIALLILGGWIAFVFLAPKDFVTTTCYLIAGLFVGISANKIANWLTSSEK